MSHLVPVQIKIKSRDSLIAALKAMGLTPKTGAGLMIDNAYWHKRNPRHYPLARRAVDVLINKEQIVSYCHTDIGWWWDATIKEFQMEADLSEMAKWVYNPKCEGYAGFKQQLAEQYMLAEVTAQYGKAVTLKREVLETGFIRTQFEVEVKDKAACRAAW